MKFIKNPSSTKAVDVIEDNNVKPEALQGKRATKQYIQMMRESQERNSHDNAYTHALEQEIKRAKQDL